ncbi:hypothetical protein, partial [Actinosynnema pretiosum]|uniref:hypothetical protein n=1 Tax=Actinosynnema pretiosum TaxID=42197 RepID=UPI0031E466F8
MALGEAVARRGDLDRERAWRGAAGRERGAAERDWQPTHENPRAVVSPNRGSLAGPLVWGRANGPHYGANGPHYGANGPHYGANGPHYGANGPHYGANGP